MGYGAGDIKGFHMCLRETLDPDKRVSYMPLKALCVYRKNGTMPLPRGNARHSVRPWRVWN